MKKIYLFSAVLLALAFITVGAAYAVSNITGNGNPMSNLVNAIATKFNLNPSDVQKVFDEQKAQMELQHKEEMVKMEAQQQQKFTDRISQAVKDGKLTQDQADKIFAKKTEIEAKRSENREAMKTQTESLKQWAADNNIPQEYLFFGGFGMGRGHGGPGFHSFSPNQLPDGTSN
jgi:hypothetical protein